MRVINVDCSICGMEWEEIELSLFNRNSYGTFLRCCECDGPIGPGSYDEISILDESE